MKPAEALVLRKAERGDAEAMHAMIIALADVTGDADRVTGRPVDYLRFGFGPDPLFDALVAERGDQAVGLCLYYFTFSTWLGEPGVFISDIYVDEAERGSGLGRRLLAAVARKARAKKATHMRLNVDAANDNARLFYSRIGMTYRDREDTFHLGGDAFIRLAEAAS